VVNYLFLLFSVILRKDEKGHFPTCYECIEFGVPKA